MNKNYKDIDTEETKEWIDSMQSIIEKDGLDRAYYILEKLISSTENKNLKSEFSQNTDYVNTIPIEKQTPYKGDRDIEKKIKFKIEL